MCRGQQKDVSPNLLTVMLLFYDWLLVFDVYLIKLERIFCIFWNTHLISLPEWNDMINTTVILYVNMKLKSLVSMISLAERPGTGGEQLICP